MSTTDPDRTTLLERCLLALDDGGAAAVDRLLEGHPDAALVRAQLDNLRSLGILQQPARANGASIPQRLGEFRLLRQLGKGGMGVVYLAEQESLQREVALKLVHPEHLYFPGARERFRREVLAVARLSHPGIVPIFTCGEADGVPYYAMERLRGATLAELIRELDGTAPEALDASALGAALQRLLQHKDDGAKGEAVAAAAFRGSWVHCCCRIVRDVAQALQHAHDHGVLHRDLKPSNIVLAADGAPRLIDFGLASAHGDQRLTRTGATFGSLPYMAPEQVRGDVAAIDARTDVYALGVTLYELLTLTLPHGDGTGTTRERILAGLAEPPTRRNAQVHRDAEAICLMAMDPDPARRYPSAAAFAQDLHAFLRHEPVRARRPGRWLRLSRQVRRHPARALAAALLFVLVVVTPSALAWQQAAAAGEIKAALAEAEHHERLAAANLDRALLAVDRMLVRTAESRLADVPRTAALRKQLLEDALSFHEQLVAETDTVRTRAERGRSRSRVGSLRIQLGDLPGGIDALRAADSDLQSVLDGSASRDLIGVRRELVRTLDELAEALGSRGEPEAQLATLDRSLQQWRLLEQGGAPDATVVLGAAKVRLNRAICLGRLGRFGEAMADMERLDAELGNSRPAELSAERNAQWQFVWANAADVRATLLTQQGETQAAWSLFLQALERLRAGAADDDSVGSRVRVAGAVERLGLLAVQRRDFDAAGPLLDEGIAAYERLAEREPDALEWQARLGGLLGSRASLRAQTGDPANGIADNDRAVTLLESVVARSPDNHGHRRRLGIACAERASLHASRREFQLARADFQRSVEAFELLLQQRADDAQTEANLIASLANLAQCEAIVPDLGAARAAIERALALARERKFGERERSLIEVLGTASDLAARDGDEQVALERIVEAGERAAAWLAAQPDDPVRLNLVAMTAVNHGTLYLSLQDHDRAKATWLAALPTAERALQLGGRMGRSIAMVLLLRLADVHDRDGDLDQARAWFQRAVQQTGAQQALVRQYPPLAALFGRAEFQDLLPPGSSRPPSGGRR